MAVDVIALIVQEQLEVLAHFRVVLNDQDRSTARRRVRRCVFRRARLRIRRRNVADWRQRNLDREDRSLSLQRAHPDRMMEEFA